MNILMLLSNPFMVDPRVYKEAKALIDNGHNVVVIVWDRKNEYELESNVDGVKVIRIKNKGLMKFLPHDLFRNPIWWRKAYKKGLQLFNTDFKFDVVHCHDLDTLQTGVWLKNKLGVKLVYDAHEIFGYMMARNMPRFIVNFALNLEKKLVKYTDFIITVNEPVENYLKSITDKPISIVMNCNDLLNKDYKSPKNDIFSVSYIGVLHKSRMFPEIVDVLGDIKDIKFVIAGKKENLYDVVKKRCEKYSNISFLGSIPFNEVIPKTLESDVVLCMINPNDMNNKIALANKQFEAMVCGRPIICTKNTYSGDMTERLKCGIVVDYTSKDLTEAIIKLRDNSKLCEELGRNALKAALEYNWGVQKEKLIKLYKRIELGV